MKRKSRLKPDASMNLATVLKRHDWYLNGAVLFLAVASLTILSSVNINIFWQQLVWFLIALGLITVFSAIEWRPLVNYKWVIVSIYLASILLLIITYFFAPSIRGTKSWLVFGEVQLQTSELSKLALIILFSYFFAKRHIGIARLSVLFKSFFYFAIPFGLILIQPDLGSAMILFSIWLGFLLVSGIRWRHIIIGFLIFILLGFWGWHNVLKDYQQDRISAFLNPDTATLGINYGVIQSKIAVGSAGLFGKGYGQGTQVQLGFLPEATTDFVLSAFIEEWGLLGGILVLSAFVLLLLRIVQIGFRCHNNFGRLISLGTAIMFLAQFIINTGSALGFLPVIGVTFPFLSYGGSSIIANAILVGIIQSIAVRSTFLR